MERIKLTPEELRTAAQKYTKGSEEVTQVLNMLTQEPAIISENWEGSTFDSFEYKFIELLLKIRGFSEPRKGIKKQLHKVAEILEQTDQDNASQICQ